MFDLPDGTVHAVSIIGGLVAAGLSTYVSVRLLKFKEEIIESVRENCASKESFDSHEERDAERFEQLRQDIGRVENRVDSVILRRQRQ
jgi:hypothetical protein